MIVVLQPPNMLILFSSAIISLLFTVITRAVYFLFVTIYNESKIYIVGVGAVGGNMLIYNVLCFCIDIIYLL